jgi:hypothetical protein
MVLRTSPRGSFAAAVAAAIASLTPSGAAGAQDVATAVSGEQAPIFAVDLSRYAISLAPVEAAPAVERAREVRFTLAPTPGAIELPDFNLGDRAEAARGAGFAIKAVPTCESEACGDLAARLALRAGEHDWRLSLNARAGFGDRFASRFGEGERSSWYLFVAADTQAMSFSFRPRDEASSLQVEDMRLLGDAQAGVGRRIHGGDLAIGFVTREVSHLGADRQENWVGLTYGWEG